MEKLSKLLLTAALMCLPLLSNADGRHVSKVCGTVPAQPEILPVTGASMNVISDHNAKTTLWLECAKQKARSNSDWNLIRTVEHAHDLWVISGLQRVRDAGYPTSEHVESVTN